jgi:hypothetical protein
MKLILPLFQLETTLGPEWARPLGLMPVANGMLLEQLVASARKWVDFAPVFVATAAGTDMITWWAETYPDQQLQSIVLDKPDVLQALRQGRDFWAGDAVLLLTGDAVVDANLGGLDQTGADVVRLVLENQAGVHPESRLHAAGAWWFRHGGLLNQGLELFDFSGQPNIWYAGLDQRLRDLDLHTTIRQVDMIEAIDRHLPPTACLLALNQRLLGFGRSSEDAIERSYGEDFTVITPVYIDDTAIIDSAVIGPYTTIAAGAEIRSSVVRNSIIGPGAVVENAVLDGAIVGEGATIIGAARSPAAAEGVVLAMEAG